MWLFCLCVFNDRMNGTDVNASADVRTIKSSIRGLPQECSGEDYSPCACITVQGGFQVTCTQEVPYVEVKAVLSRSKARDLNQLYIYSWDPNVPENVTGGISANVI